MDRLTSVAQNDETMSMCQLCRDLLPQLYELERSDQRASLLAATYVADVWGTGPVVVVGRPDELDRENPAVDLLVEDNLGLIAVEHTRVEAFEQQIKWSSHLRLVLPEGGVRTAFEHSSHLQVCLNAEQLQSVRVREADAFRAALADLIETVAPSLVMTGRPQDGVRSGLSVEGVSVTIGRWANDVELVPADSLARVVMAAPEDRDELRLDRVRRAVEEKMPKLLVEGLSWSTNGARTRRWRLVVVQRLGGDFGCSLRVRGDGRQPAGCARPSAALARRSLRSPPALSGRVVDRPSEAMVRTRRRITSR